MAKLITHWISRILCVVLSVLMIIGCGTTSQFVPGIGKKYVYSYRMTSPVADKEMVFQDGRIAVSFSIDEAAVLFRLENRTDRTMHILWDEVVIGVDGRFTRVRHAPDFYVDSLYGTSFPLPGRGFMRDLLIPAGNINFSEGRWVETPLFPTVDNRSDSIRALIMGSQGKQVRVVLPIRFQSGRVDYEFAFAVDTVNEIAWRDYVPVQREPRPPVVSRTKSRDQLALTVAIVVGFLGMFALLIGADKDPPSE